MTDAEADFVADPFMVRESSTWHMFFEVMNARSGQGDIGLAVSRDGFRWAYQQIVLDEPFHLSYPYVFKWRGDYYMMPESHKAKSVRLYKAYEFPYRWSLVTTSLEGHALTDPSPFYIRDAWWLFVSSPSNDTLRLFYA